MSDTFVDANGVLTVPQDILEKLNVAPGDRVRFTLLETGAVIIRAKNRSIKDLAGALYREGQPAVPIEKMSPWK
jgi:antitoxin PrlF